MSHGYFNTSKHSLIEKQTNESISLQIILLTFSSNYYTRGLYRLHAGMLNGGTLAIYFPVTATRLFPFEVELYYIQHILILTVPIFLLTSHG